MSARREKKPSSLPLPDAWDGTAEGKERLHREVSVVLRAAAGHLGLDVSMRGCEIRSNKMGPASGGYVSLLADRFHLIVDLGSRGEWGAPCAGTVTARATRARDDHAGSGPILDLPWELLWDPERLAEVLVIEGLGATREKSA